MDIRRLDLCRLDLLAINLDHHEVAAMRAKEANLALDAHDAARVTLVQNLEEARVLVKSSRQTIVDYAAGVDRQAPFLIDHENGYCKTCGDMYVRGYECQHSRCRKIGAS